MANVMVEDVMTPAEALPGISADTSLLDAAEALKRSAMNAPVPLLVAVRDDEGGVAGILGMVALLRGLNPRYEDEGFFADMADKGFDPAMLGMFVEKYTVHHEPLEKMFQAASTRRVGSLLEEPDRDETVDARASLDVAMDLMVLRRRDYLLVTREGTTVGVVDAANVYDAIRSRAGGVAGIEAVAGTGAEKEETEVETAGTSKAMKAGQAAG